MGVWKSDALWVDCMQLERRGRRERKEKGEEKGKRKKEKGKGKKEKKKEKGKIKKI